LRDWMASGERLLLHQEELGDRLMGVVAGYLRWSGLVPAGPQAITVVERILHRQMGPEGRMLVALAPDLAGAPGRPRVASVPSREVVASVCPPAPTPDIGPGIGAGQEIIGGASLGAADGERNPG
jgi:hypothetical protein